MTIIRKGIWNININMNHSFFKINSRIKLLNQDNINNKENNKTKILKLITTTARKENWM